MRPFRQISQETYRKRYHKQKLPPDEKQPIRALDRIVTCEQCRWTGRMGKIMFLDKLRCPKCGSEHFGYLVPDEPTALQ